MHIKHSVMPKFGSYAIRSSRHNIFMHLGITHTVAFYFRILKPGLSGTQSGNGDACAKQNSSIMCLLTNASCSAKRVACPAPSGCAPGCSFRFSKINHADKASISATKAVAVALVQGGMEGRNLIQGYKMEWAPANILASSRRSDAPSEMWMR